LVDEVVALVAIENRLRLLEGEHAYDGSEELAKLQLELRCVLSASATRGIRGASLAGRALAFFLYWAPAGFLLRAILLHLRRHLSRDYLC